MAVKEPVVFVGGLAPASNVTNVLLIIIPSPVAEIFSLFSGSGCAMAFCAGKGSDWLELGLECDMSAKHDRAWAY